MRRVWIAGASAFSVIFLASCGILNKPESAGVISVVDGEVRKLTSEEEKAYCEKQYCEPNYIYAANFGSAPAPAPAPTGIPNQPVPIFPPNPTPTPPTPVTPPSGVISGYLDRVDYAKAILRVADAWQISQGNREIVVAVVDTGVAITHPDLKENLWTDSAGAYGYDFHNNRPNAIDDNKHGTHVAGIIGAELNGIGTAGISPKVRIMPLKFLDSNGTGDTTAAIKAINYAVDHGAKIISNSWGGGGRSELLNQAIQNAIAKGVIVVAAAGNEANNNDGLPSYPASFPGVISVASSDEGDSLSSFSNYGKSSVTIAAPGSHIYSSVLGNAWNYLSGTSMATPQVSGALALAMSANPALNATQLSAILCQSSKKILLDRVNCGRLDVYEFVKKAAGL